MSFKEFDLSEYIHALEDFKVNQTDTIIKHWGSWCQNINSTSQNENSL